MGKLHKEIPKSISHEVPKEDAGTQGGHGAGPSQERQVQAQSEPGTSISASTEHQAQGGHKPGRHKPGTSWAQTRNEPKTGAAANVENHLC